MRNMKKYRYGMTGLLGVFIAMMAILSVKANGAVVGTLQQTVQETEIKQEPNDDSDTLASLAAGTAVIVYGESQDLWSKVEYREIEGYIKSEALEMYAAEYSEELEQEFRVVEEEMLRTADEYELMQKEKHTATIWGTVIAVLVIAIFAVGIVSALKQNKEKEGEEQ